MVEDDQHHGAGAKEHGKTVQIFVRDHGEMDDRKVLLEESMGRLKRSGPDELEIEECTVVIELSELNSRDASGALNDKMHGTLLEIDQISKFKYRETHQVI